MLNRSTHCRRFLAALLAGVALAWAGLRGESQAQAPPPVASAQFDPSDVYFQAYLEIRSAEQYATDENFLAALGKCEQATKLLNSVATYYPQWKPAMVAGRAAKTRETIAQLRPKAEAQRNKQQRVVAELEGGQKNPARAANPPPVAPPPSILKVDPLTERRLHENEAEVARLRKLLHDSITPPAEVARNAEHLRDLEQLRDSLKDQLRAAEANAENLRSRLAKAPVESEVNGLNQRIEKLEQEREAMAMALTQSRSEHTKSLSKVAILEADLKVASQRAADLQRDLDLQRKTANATVSGMRRQLQSLQESLTKKTQALAAANQQIGGLQQQLQQSHDAFTQLRDERDDLVAERDQMKALLKLNEAGRVQDLIEQNMGLAKNLREKSEALDALNRDNNATKDDFTDALRDLAVAKSQINRLNQDRRAQDKRLADLENRLKQEQSLLASASASAADPAELETLRGIIKRQLITQERRHQASQILVEAAKQLGASDANVSSAISLLEGDEIPLSVDEQRLLAGRADIELIAPSAKNLQTDAQSNLHSSKNIEVYDRAATKAFTSDRLLPARELFQLILEDHPGHVSSLCKLGVVDLRLNEPAAAADTFRRAIQLDDNNPYAHRMLGVARMALGDISAAEQSVRHSMALAPDDAKTQNLLATIVYRLGRPSESEALYKDAIRTDPIPSEPYFNLALLYAHRKHFHDARSYYHQALERGALPDAKLEQSINSH